MTKLNPILLRFLKDSGRYNAFKRCLKCNNEIKTKKYSSPVRLYNDVFNDSEFLMYLCKGNKDICANLLKKYLKKCNAYKIFNSNIDPRFINGQLGLNEIIPNNVVFFDYLIEKVDPRNYIMDAFSWICTPQGFDYWHSLCIGYHSYLYEEALKIYAEQ